MLHADAHQYFAKYKLFQYFLHPELRFVAQGHKTGVRYDPSVSAPNSSKQSGGALKPSLKAEELHCSPVYISACLQNPLPWGQQLLMLQK